MLAVLKVKRYIDPESREYVTMKLAGCTKLVWIWPPPLYQAAVSFSKHFERWNNASQKFP